MPATNYIPQRPCDGKLLAIEAMGVGQGMGEVEIERLGEQLVITRHNDITWVHCAQMVPQAVEPQACMTAPPRFRNAVGLLGRVGVGLDQVIRTWLYLGGIVAHEGGVQRYRRSTGRGATSTTAFPFWPTACPQAVPARSIRPARASAPMVATS